MALNASADLLVKPQLLLQRLLAACPTLADRPSLAVGYSGGLDSTVLLHVLHSLHQQGLLKAPIRALHIHHGLQAQADQWERQCRQQCEDWRLPFASKRVQVSHSQGLGLEEAARHARYQGFAELLLADESLVLAHHADDQAETLLLNLLRGSGLLGMAGIPSSRSLSSGVLAGSALTSGEVLRPLLTVPRAALHAYAVHHKLAWLDDPSNADNRFDRNYLRNMVLPLLLQRWPATAHSLGRTSQLAAEATTLLAEQAQADLEAAALAFPNRLPLAILTNHSTARQRNLLRYWLQQQVYVWSVHQCTYQESQRCWQELVQTISADYRFIELAGGRLRLHRYRQCLYLLPPLPAPPSSSPQSFSEQWPLLQPLHLPAPCGQLQWNPLQAALANEIGTLQVSFGSSGLRVPKANGQHQTLQHHYQDRGIPPWLRPFVPLIFLDGDLVAIADEILPLTRLVNLGANQQTLRWEKSLLLCGW
jgi:tRNA(Ile)-lysidine synthase